MGNSNKIKLIYLTYQVFPNPKANNLQTIRMLESFQSQGIHTKLIFPDRGVQSKNPEEIFKFYGVKNKFLIETLKHKLPFNSINYAQKLNFRISSFIWSYFAVNKIIKSVNNQTIFYTRTNWILLFLAKKKNLIVYECHKENRVDNYIFKKIQNNKNIILIFPSEKLKAFYTLKYPKLMNVLVLPSAYDERMFSNFIQKEKNRVIFVGNLLRFNVSRNIEFIINAFNDPRLENYKLSIIGGPNDFAKSLSKTNKNSNIEILGHLKHQDAVQKMRTGEIGILINIEDSNSTFYTSPIKYFEYIKGGLKVVAVDFASHRNLPFKDNIYFFQNNNLESLIENIILASKSSFIKNNLISNYSYDNRVNNIVSYLARLEGLEPPTL